MVEADHGFQLHTHVRATALIDDDHCPCSSTEADPGLPATAQVPDPTLSRLYTKARLITLYGPADLPTSSNSLCCFVGETHACRARSQPVPLQVGILQDLLAHTSEERAQWILWADADTIVEVGVLISGLLLIFCQKPKPCMLWDSCFLMGRGAVRRKQELAYEMPFHWYGRQKHRGLVSLPIVYSRLAREREQV